jgi:outer membrane protein
MNKKAVWFIGGFALSLATYVFIASSPLAQSDANSGSQPKIAIVNFKHCLENSKLGRQEQSRFDEIKKQMETQLEDKEKQLNDLAPKFKDDYLDTLTPEAEAELKNKAKTINQEFYQLQNQYGQLMNQAQFQIVQKLTDWIAQASSKIAKQKSIDIILNEEACFSVSPNYDISKDVVKELDTMLSKDEKVTPKAK